MIWFELWCRGAAGQRGADGGGYGGDNVRLFRLEGKRRERLRMGRPREERGVAEGDGFIPLGGVPGADTRAAMRPVDVDGERG